MYEPSRRELEAPRLVSGAIGTVADWGRLPEIDATALPLAQQVEAVALAAEALNKELENSVPVLQTVFSPFTVASYLAAGRRAEARRSLLYLIARDQPRAVRHLRTRPELVGRALERIAETLADFVGRSLAAGADGIFYAVGGSASADVMSLSEYEELLLPLDRRILAAVPNGFITVLHLCGPRLHFELACELPVSAVSWSASAAGNPSLVEGRGRASCTVMGGVAEVAALMCGTPGSVRRDVETTIAETGGIGLVIAPGCSVPPGVPDANLHALIGSCERFTSRRRL